MTTSGERLVTLAGTGGVAKDLLQVIGTGSTTGAALVNYSGLASATAAIHLLTDVVTATLVKYWDGAQWIAKPLKYWDGASWQSKTLKYFDGSAWV